MTRISTKHVSPEEAQGRIEFYTAGSNRLTIDNTGNATFAGSIAGSPTLTGAISVGGASDTIGFFGATAVGVQATTATTGTFAAAAGTAALSGSTWVGNTGTKAYTVGDIISALKKYGLLTA